MKYIAIRKNSVIDEKLKQYKFIFGDKSSLLNFEKLNNIKAFLYTEVDKTSKIYINDSMFFQLFTLKLLNYGFKNIYIYKDKSFPNIEIKYNLYDSFVKYEYNDNIVYVDDFEQNSALLAYDISSKKVDLIVLKNDSDKIYEFSKILKANNPKWKILLYGNTTTPKKDLLSNCVDFVLLKGDIKQLKNNYLKNIKGLYFYDDDYSIRYVD